MNIGQKMKTTQLSLSLLAVSMLAGCVAYAPAEGPYYDGAPGYYESAPDYYQTDIYIIDSDGRRHPRPHRPHPGYKPGTGSHSGPHHDHGDGKRSVAPPAGGTPPSAPSPDRDGRREDSGRHGGHDRSDDRDGPRGRR